MKGIYYLLCLLFISSYSSAQFSYGIYSLEDYNECGCEIYLYTALIPNAPLTYDLPGPHTETGGETVIGNLDKFVDENCERSVYVKVRESDNGQIKYYYDEMVPNIRGVLTKYHRFSSICFKGVFNFSKIDIDWSKNIKLLNYTRFHYIGDGSTPAISFNSNGSSLEGGAIVTETSMNQGLISIHSEGSGDGFQNRFSNQIKNTKLVQTGNTGSPTGHDAIADRAIVMTNTFESLSTHSDNGVNYYTNISNVDVSGFAVGLHLRGWSNAALIRNISFEDISGYGLWVSGCADNSYTNLTFNNCNSASAIRLDNYVDHRYQNYMIGGQPIDLPDPNYRARIMTELQLAPLLSNSNDQEKFNKNLADILIDNIDPPSYYALLEACGNPDATNPNEVAEVFANRTSENSNGLYIRKFGLMGYADDTLDVNDISNYFNYEPDNIDVTGVDNDPFSSVINFYNLDYNHPETNEPVNLPTIKLLHPTCLESPPSLTSFFKIPTVNSFAGVNIFKDGIQQVYKLVEIEGREDGGDICQKETEDPNSNCEKCYFDVNGHLKFSAGWRNTIHACNVPAGITITNLIDDKLGCGLVAANGVPALEVIVH